MNPVFYVLTLDHSGEGYRPPIAFASDMVAHCTALPLAKQFIEQIAARLEEPAIDFSIAWERSDGELVLYCRHQQGIATARLRYRGKPMRYCLLLSVMDRDADQDALKRFQKLIVNEVRDTGTEPAFDLLGVRERPLLATYDFSESSDERFNQFTDILQQCLAIAFFDAKKDI